MSQIIMQSSFQFGEVSELLSAQVTSPIYYKAARRLRNVVVVPQGGVKKRFGLDFKYSLGEDLYYKQIKSKWFEHSDGKRYFLVFWSLDLKIFYQGALVAELTTPFQAQYIQSLSVSQSSNYMIIASESYKPSILTRTTHPGTWSLNTTTNFINYPQYDFKQDYYNLFFQVRSGTVLATAGSAYNPPILVLSQNIPGTKVWILTFSDSADTGIEYFDESAIDGYFYMSGGTVKITGINRSFSATITNVRYFAEGIIVTPFTNNANNFNSSNQLVQKPGTDVVFTQKVFSDENGWPKKVSFFQNRIWFGNTGKLSAGLWGSNYAGFSEKGFNFDESEALATNSVGTILAGDKPIVIRDIISYKTLVVLTNHGLYSTPLFTDTPITPTNIQFINKQSADTSNSVPGVILENNVVFAIQGGNRIKNLTVASQGYTYQTNTLSTLCPHLIDDPVSMDTYQNGAIDDSNWLFVVNSGTKEEGTIAVYQSVPEQQITAWTLCVPESGDYFREVASLDDEVYFIVERSYNNKTFLQIEELNFFSMTDNTYYQNNLTAVTAITGATNLAGKTVQIIADDIFVGTVSVDASGNCTSPVAAKKFKLGLLFKPLVRPMPLNFPTQLGSSLYFPRTIQTMYVDYFESTGIKVNNDLLPDFQLDVDHFDQKPPLKTGFSKLEQFNGWDPRQNIDITQDIPSPFQVLGIGYVVTI